MCKTCGGTGHVITPNGARKCPTCNTARAVYRPPRRQGNLERGFRSHIPNPADLPQGDELTPDELQADLEARFGFMTRNR